MRKKAIPRDDAKGWRQEALKQRKAVRDLTTSVSHFRLVPNRSPNEPAGKHGSRQDNCSSHERSGDGERHGQALRSGANVFDKTVS